jgi:hypothetical protein
MQGGWFEAKSLFDRSRQQRADFAALRHSSMEGLSLAPEPMPEFVHLAQRGSWERRSSIRP